MTLTAWTTVAALCALGAMSPGPSLAVVSRHTLTGGRAAGSTAALAHGLAIGLYALASVSGIAALLTRSPTAFAALQWAGALWLAWLGLKALTVRPAGASEGTENTDGATPDRRGAARDGFLVAFLNPKVAVFFLALFSQVVGPDTTATERALYAGTAMTIDAAWYLLVAWGLSRPRWLGWLQRHARWIDRLFGMILVALAARLVYQALGG